jgi:hypothetical protein
LAFSKIRTPGLEQAAEKAVFETVKRTSGAKESA